MSNYPIKIEVSVRAVPVDKSRLAFESPGRRFS